MDLIGYGLVVALAVASFAAGHTVGFKRGFFTGGHWALDDIYENVIPAQSREWFMEMLKARAERLGWRQRNVA